MLKNKQNETFAIFCAIFIIFSALFDPLLSLGVAIGALGTIFIYKIK
jgi:hypothetical protein